MRAIRVLMLAFALFLTVPVLAGSHGACCMIGGGGMIGPRPLLVGGGAVAFRRSDRLGFRANRAASFGLIGRANRLDNRSQAAFNRGLFRNARFNGF